MIEKIDLISEFGLLNENNEYNLSFSKFNLIYGWNGSGKSTLGRFLQIFEQDVDHELTSNCKFKVTISDTQINEINYKEFGFKIRVFNKTFVDQNISWDSSTTSTINGIGFADIQIKEEIKKLEFKISKFQAENEISRTRFYTVKNELDKIYKAKSNEIKRLIGSNQSKDVYTNYNKSSFSDMMLKYTLDDSDKLSEEELKIKIKFITSDQKEILEYKSVLECLVSLETTVALVLKTISYKKIQRWVSLESWPKESVDLHKANNQKENCFFCGGLLTEKFWDQVSMHFSKEFTDLASACNKEIDFLERFNFKSLYEINKSELYEVYRESFESSFKEFSETAKPYLLFLSQLSNMLIAKKSNPSYTSPVAQEKAEELLRISKKIWKIDLLLRKTIELHNNTVLTHSKKVNEEKSSVEKSFAADFCEEYIKLNTELHRLKNKIEITEKNLISMDKELQGLVQKSSNHQININKFNELLNSFLARKEISLDITSEPKGVTFYSIYRHGSLATNLSDGERAAFSFVYFILSVDPIDKDSILVFDDPVSSLDANFLFNLFSFMQIKSKKIKQIFILTHNFSLMKLTLRWLKEKNKRKRPVGKLDPSKFFMIENKTSTENIRTANLAVLHKFLIDYESEYEYIYKTAFDYINDAGTGSLERFYNVPNLCRKLLETFLNFKIPGKSGIKDKMMSLQLLEETQVGRIFEFINVHSHAGPSRAEGIDISLLEETPSIVAEIFDFIRKADEGHFNAMEKIIKKMTKDV